MDRDVETRAAAVKLSLDYHSNERVGDTSNEVTILRSAKVFETALVYGMDSGIALAENGVTTGEPTT